MSVKTIKQKSYSDITNEYEAGGGITPGHNVRLNASGNVIVNPTATGPAPALFALEDELQGKTTRDAYVSGDRVQVWAVQSGEEVLAIIDSALDPSIGDILEPSTDGELQAQSAGNGPLYEVLEAKQIDADSNHRILVRRI